MANVLEERVEVAALKGDYQFGFHDPDQSVFRARKGLDREIIEQISGHQGRTRLDARQPFEGIRHFPAKTDARLGRQCGPDGLR